MRPFCSTAPPIVMPQTCQGVVRRVIQSHNEGTWAKFRRKVKNANARAFWETSTACNVSFLYMCAEAQVTHGAQEQESR
jgi:hypothetical protein